MRGKAIFSITWVVKPLRLSVRPLLYASALSAGVLLCAASAHADDRDQLKSIQADIAAKERAVRQQQQQRSALLAQLKQQEGIIIKYFSKEQEYRYDMLTWDSIVRAAAFIAAQGAFVWEKPQSGLFEYFFHFFRHLSCQKYGREGRSLSETKKKKILSFL